MSMPRVALPEWSPCYRLIPSRFPPVSLFDQVASPDQLDVVFALQSLTNPRLRQEVGEISLVPKQDRVCGPGSTPVMAAFCHLNVEGSRFSDGTYGVYYAASSIEAAASEVSHHPARFFAATQQPEIDVDMRVYVAKACAPLHDLRSRAWSRMHAPDDYSQSQEIGRKLRAAGSYGVLYRSVRAPGHQCVGVFRPTAIEVPVVQGPHVSLRWNGARITGWYEKSDIKPL